MRERTLILTVIAGFVATTITAQPNSDHYEIATCNFEEHQPTNKNKQPNTRGYIGNSNNTNDVYALESRPGAPFAILLDFDGNGADGKSPYGGFGNNSYQTVNPSDDYVKRIWEHMADDFIAFNVNITTSHEVYNSYPTSKKIIAAFAEFGLPGWKGVAYVGSFGSGKAALIDVDLSPPTSDASVDARVGSHEVGHSLGLSHDGGGGDPYYSGHGEYVPIMGSGSKHVTHWSRGEYSSATNNEDDITIISQTLDFVPDDIQQFKELQYDASGSINANDNAGTITSRSDKDLFQFEMQSSGSINVTVSTAISWSNLDVRLRLLDGNKNEIQSVNPVGLRSATISTSIPSAGTYYLEIDGDGELSVNTGWSDYSSMGYYEISGSITGFKPILYDANLNTIAGFGDVCEEFITPVISVENKGINTINELNFDLFIDGNFFRSESIQVNLAAGSSNTYQLSQLKETGEHAVRVEISIKNQTDQITFNNAATSNYHLIQGKTFRFETNYDQFNGSNPFSWEVKHQSTGVEIIKSTEVEIVKNNTIQQDFCLSGGCYQFSMSGDFDPCLGYSAYTSGSYSGGETVALNGNLYKAKWWTNNKPPSAEWENLGACPAVKATFTLTDIDTKEAIINEPSTSLNGNYSEDFCVDLATGIESNNSTAVLVKLYPNPAYDLLNIESNSTINSITVYTITGALVGKEKTNSLFYQYNLSQLQPGIYTLQIETNGVVQSQLIVKK